MVGSRGVRRVGGSGWEGCGLPGGGVGGRRGACGGGGKGGGGREEGRPGARRRGQDGALVPAHGRPIRLQCKRAMMTMLVMGRMMKMVVTGSSGGRILWPFSRAWNAAVPPTLEDSGG